MAISPRLLLSTVTDELVDDSVVNTFRGQARNERLSEHVPSSQILPLAAGNGVFKAMVQRLGSEGLAHCGE
jgi:hypothetical protein